MPKPGVPESALEMFQKSMLDVTPKDVPPSATAYDNLAIAREISDAKLHPATKHGSIANVQVSFIQNPDRGPSFDQRHDKLLIVRNTIEALLSNKPDDIEQFRQQFMRKGGFLLNYGKLEVGRKRIEGAFRSDMPAKGGWLMVETSAIPVSNQSSGLVPTRVIGADGQFYIPPDTDNCPVNEHPLPDRDKVLDCRHVYDEIVDNPACAMVVSDICAVEEYRRFGFASATEDAAFFRVINEINDERDRIIKYVLAAMASIKGIQDKNGRLIRPILEPGIRNLVSMLLHVARTERADGFILGKQTTHPPIDVELPCGEPGRLIVDFYVTAQPLERINPRRDIIVKNEENF